MLIRTTKGLRGATVARLTPDQKVACSNHVGVNIFCIINLTKPKHINVNIHPNHIRNGKAFEVLYRNDVHRVRIGSIAKF